MIMGKVGGLVVVRSLRLSSELGGITLRSGFERNHGLAVSIRHQSQSSTSNWGTGEPPVDDTQTVRGVTAGQPAATAEKPAGRQADEPTSPSDVATGAATGQQAKKSRTGGDMSDEGQVHTPNLQKMRSTRDIIHDAGREKKDRLESEKKSAA